MSFAAVSSRQCLAAWWRPLVVPFALGCCLFFTGCAKETKPVEGVVVTLRGCNKLKPMNWVSNGNCFIIQYGDSTVMNYCGNEPENQYKPYCTGEEKEAWL